MVNDNIPTWEELYPKLNDYVNNIKEYSRKFDELQLDSEDVIDSNQRSRQLLIYQQQETLAFKRTTLKKLQTYFEANGMRKGYELFADSVDYNYTQTSQHLLVLDEELQRFEDPCEQGSIN